MDCLDTGPVWLQAGGWHSRASGAGTEVHSWLQGALSGEGVCAIEVLSSLPQIEATLAASWLRDSPALAVSGQSHRPYVAGRK